MLAEIRAGLRKLSAGAFAEGRANWGSALVVADGSLRYEEDALQQAIFHLVLAATTTGVAAGNIAGAGAAASTQFALWNPIGSGKRIVLAKFGMGIVSGTPGAGPMFHGLLLSGLPTIASVGAANNAWANGPAPVAKVVASAAGAALTGGGAPTTLRVADFASTGTAQASPGALKAIECLDGDIVLPPGTGWLPLWSAAGTALLNGYSVSWKEIPEVTI